MNPSSLTARAALLVLALSSIAHAREHTRLVVTRQQSATECPDERALSDAVGARLGDEPFAADASSLVVVAFRREGKTLLATVQLQDALGTVQGERTLSSAQGDCDELAATTALTISILLDPRSTTAPPGPPAPEPKTDPALQPELAQPTALRPPLGEPQGSPGVRATVRAASTSSGSGSQQRSVAQTSALPKEGRHASGVSVLPVALGPIQAFSSGGHAFGLRFGLGAQFDLGPRWALRLPLVFAIAARGSRADYAELDLTPGVIFRFRNRADEAFTPYVGVGVKFGGFGAGRALLGKPLVSSIGSSIASLFDEQGYVDDPNFESTISVGAEGTLGSSWHVNRSFSLDFELNAELVPIAGDLVEVVAQTAAARFTF